MFILHLVWRRLHATQSLDAQDGRADGDAELQDWRDNQDRVDASQDHLMAQNTRESQQVIANTYTSRQDAGVLYEFFCFLNCTNSANYTWSLWLDGVTSTSELQV